MKAQARVVVSASCAHRTHHGDVPLRNIKYNLFLPILQKHILYIKFLPSHIKLKRRKKILRATLCSLLREDRICCM